MSRQVSSGSAGEYRQMSWQLSRGSGAEYQADEPAGVPRHSSRVSGRKDFLDIIKLQALRRGEYPG